ncbi:2-dehydro-3-deoxy-6-phosphogalactonate aldolase [Diplonema papillatum]|nr:2-dehydro-3-deoxy-6-phosphogalactonate aldolase [Diplonema papillatum]|eukprot:gene1761-2678_t
MGGDTSALDYVVVDWGTTSFRAHRVENGVVTGTVEDPTGGVLSVADGLFEQRLCERIAHWQPSRVFLVGMVGSRAGWKEAPYVPSPASAAALRGAAPHFFLEKVDFSSTFSSGGDSPQNRRVSVTIVPGVSHADGGGSSPDVMRGEETQVLATGADGVHVCPGTHSKWAVVAGGEIAAFRTFLTGDAFRALARGTILAASVGGQPAELSSPDGLRWFHHGLSSSAGRGFPGDRGLLHDLFTVRTKTLSGELPREHAPAFLSGLLIGDELQSARGFLQQAGACGPPGGRRLPKSVHLIGADGLASLYAEAVRHSWGVPVCRVTARDAVVRGVRTIFFGGPRLETPAAAPPGPVDHRGGGWDGVPRVHDPSRAAAPVSHVFGPSEGSRSKAGVGGTTAESSPAAPSGAARTRRPDGTEQAPAEGAPAPGAAAVPRVVAILRGVLPEEVVAVADALVAAGVTAVEVPLNSPQPFESIRLLAERFRHRRPAVLVGAGTVLTPADVLSVHRSGGRLIVSPDVNRGVITLSRQLGLVTVPGVATPTEAFRAISYGADALKLFPAEVAGPKGLKAMAAVLPPRFPVLAVGGVTVDNLKEWKAAGAHGFGVGSSLYKPRMSPEVVRSKATEFVSRVTELYASSKL